MTKEQEAIILKAAEILLARNRARRVMVHSVKREPKREMSLAKEMFHNCTGGIFED